MGIVVNTNVPAIMVQRNLSTATDNLNASIEKMSTGLRINRAADDAAGLYVASGLEKQIRGSEICEGSVQTGINILGIAEGDLSLINEHLMRIRDLAVEAASDYYTQAARDAMAEEALARTTEINRIAGASNFNGLLLLSSGTTIPAAGLAIQVGPNSSDTVTITGVFGAADAATLGLDISKMVATASGDYFYDTTGATTLIGLCDTAITTVNGKVAKIGANQSRLESAYDSLTVSIENLSAAKSTIMDADIAKESTEYTKQQILQQTAAALLIQANQSPGVALSLI